jgi:hypothetical protein
LIQRDGLNKEVSSRPRRESQLGLDIQQREFLLLKENENLYNSNN